jgi:Tfp pilus assembly protein PilF
MRNIKCSACFFFLLCLVEGMTTLGSEKGSSISGGLTLSDAGTNCDRVEVDLEHPMGFDSRKAYTDWFCNFTFSNLEPGTYYLHVAMPGYMDSRETIQVEDSVNETVMLPLKRATDRPADSSTSGSFVVDVSEFRRPQPVAAVRLYQESLVSRKKGETQEATRLLEKAIETAPDFYAAHNDLGLAYESDGRFEAAADQLWKAHAINMKNAQPLINLGSLYLITGDLEEAKRVSNMAVEADSHSPFAFFNLGMALYRRSELQQAETAFLKTLCLAPSMMVTRLPLAGVYVKLGKLDHATKQLDIFLEKAPASPQRTEAEQLREGIQEAIKEQAN